jgi:hypothetical protein
MEVRGTSIQVPQMQLEMMNAASVRLVALPEGVNL